MVKKTTQRKSAFIKLFRTFLVCLFALPIGYSIGNSYIDNYFNQTTFSEEELVDNFDTIDYLGKTPDQLSASDVFFGCRKYFVKSNIFFRLFQYTFACTNNFANCWAFYGKKGNSFVQESYSTGLVNLATRSEYTDGGTVLILDGKRNKDNSTVAWSGGENLSKETYKSRYGKDPDQLWCYIVSSKTVISSSDCEIIDGVYYYTMTLDPVTSTMNYKQQIKTLSELPSYPTFSSVSIKFAVDENFRFVYFESRETYLVSYFGAKLTIKNDDSRPYITTFNYTEKA